MQQLKFKELAKLFDELKKKYKIEEIMEMPIYIGDDDELNGVHTAWYCYEIKDKDKDSEDVIKMIKGNNTNVEFKDKAIFIG